MIPLPFKSTARVDVATPIAAFLTSRYSAAEAARHADKVAAFQALRNDVASIKSANEGARAALLNYYQQCDSAKEKIPVSETSVAKIAFIWTDSLKPDPTRAVSQFSWAYEQACIIFNLAALESQFAAAVARDSPEAIERATKLFCTAAGILAHLRDSVASMLIGTLPYDLTREGLNMLISLQLGQAQACYYELAQMKGMKPETIARIAAQTADHYRAASKALPEVAMRDIDATFPWSTYLRHHFASFDAAAFWAMSHKARAEAESKGDGFGVELAWLNVAKNAAGLAVSTVQTSPAAVAAGMTTGHTELLFSKVSARWEEANTDNLKIYMNLVPPARDLPQISRAELAKPGAMIDLTAAKAVPLFAGVVPVEVATSLQTLEDRLTALVTELRDRGTARGEEARAALAAMGLPGYLDAADASSGGGVPPALWERIRRTQIEGGLSELTLSLTQNGAAATAANDTLRRTLQVLDDEAAADSSCRRSYGDRWTAAPSELVAAELRGEVAKFTEIARTAAASDDKVRGKMEASRARLAALSKSKADLDASLPLPPTGAAGGSDGAALRAQLKEAVAALTASLEARSRLANEVKERFDRAAATSAFLAAASPAEHAAIADRLLSTPTAQRAAFDENMAAQARQMELVAALHTRYAEIRARDERTRARERALQELNESVDAFEELRSNVREGATFYADLRAHADRLLTQASDMAAARGLQQRELMMAIRAATEARERTDADAAMASSITRYGSGGAGGAGASAAPAAAYPGTSLRTATMGSSAVGSYGAAPPSWPTGSTAMAVPLGPVAPVAPVPAPAPAPAPAAAPRGFMAGVWSGFGSSAPMAPAGSGYNPFDAWPAAGAAPAPAAAGGYSGAMTPGFAPGPSAAPAAAASGPAPSSQVTQLMNMGFERRSAEMALASTGGDVGRAVAALLDGTVRSGV